MMIYSGLVGVVEKCEKALEKLQDRSIGGRIKAFMNVSNVKEEITEMNKEVNRMNAKFMVCPSHASISNYGN